MRKEPSRRDSLLAQLTGIDAEAVQLREQAEGMRITIDELCGRQEDLLHVVAGGGDRAQLIELNQALHSCRLTLETFEGALATLAAKRRGLEAEIKEVEMIEKRAQLHELDRKRAQICDEFRQLMGQAGLMLDRIDEVQGAADGLHAELGEHGDWHRFKRPLSEAASETLITSRGARALDMSYSAGRPRQALANAAAIGEEAIAV